MREQLELINQACKAYLNNRLLTHQENISMFIQRTEDLGVPLRDRCISLAWTIRDERPWAEVCAVFETALSREQEPEGVDSLFNSWLCLGFDAVLESSDQDKQKLCLECIEIAERALAAEPEHPAFAYMLGLFNFHKPAGSRDRQPHLIEALTWFERSVLWQNHAGGEEPDWDALLHKARCLFGLSRWSEALDLYKSLDVKHLSTDDEQLRDEVKNCTAECLKRLNTCA